MKVNNRYFTTIWVHPEDDRIIQVIDQRELPFRFIVADLKTFDDAFYAIKDMVIRGAPLIGVAGAYAIYLSLLGYSGKAGGLQRHIREASEHIKSARPTAINLSVLVDEMVGSLIGCSSKEEALSVALAKAGELKEREAWRSKAIGEQGCGIVEDIYKKGEGRAVNILTHCNAGWLACIDWGTAIAPIYEANNKGIPVHVWVDETRPRNQGARLTAWELQQEGVPYTIIPDNAGGHLMQRGMVDVCIVGSDCTTYIGDVANKIGTYLKALAAYDNGIPFYVALPSSTIDFTLTDGITQIPIEQRDASEIAYMEGISEKNEISSVRIMMEESSVVNYGFDVTPAKYVTGLITEIGVCEATKEGISKLFADKSI